MRVVYFLLFSNVIFFAVSLVIFCVAIAVNIKFKDLYNHSTSAPLLMRDSAREYKEHMDKMERTRKYFREEEKLNADSFDPQKTAESADLGTKRDKEQHYMDDI